MNLGDFFTTLVGDKLQSIGIPGKTTEYDGAVVGTALGVNGRQLGVAAIDQGAVAVQGTSKGGTPGSKGHKCNSLGYVAV